MTSFKINDKVAVLDDAIDGVVLSVQKEHVTIETSDGFVMTYFVNELIKVNDTSNLDNLIKSNSLLKKDIDIHPPKKQNQPK